MARLNDAVPAPLDPVELLRRKYSRQNKEIARVNSTQCIRIRALENEIACLLTENLELREQIIRLQAVNANNVREIKSKLEAKLLEVTAFVTSLGDEQEGDTIKAGGATDDLNRTPDRKNWRNMRTLSEAAGLEDDRLPPILEDKYYPRRTLELAELEAILSDTATNNSDSPDIGPPPVSKFVEIPVLIDLPEKVGENQAECPGIDRSRSIHLEQRRKRKDTMEISESKRTGRTELNLGLGTEVAQPLKTGAKRKLSSRDEEEVESNFKTKEIPADDFKVMRANDDRSLDRTFAVTEKRGSKASRETAIARGIISHEKSVGNIGSNTRKALAPKSVNYDVANSPKKAIKPVLLDVIQSSKALVPQKEPRREPSRELPKEHRTTSHYGQPPTEAVEIHIEPETPAAPDLISPQSSEPSTAHAESRDTPPPSELGSGTEGQRPSRRSKGSVSYAEPNLRDKMRRPTNELVDAVTGEGRGQRISLSRVENEPPLVAEKIKEENEVGDTWKNLPLDSSANIYSKSPLVDRGYSLENATQRRRKGPSTHNNDGSELSRSRPSTAISALLAGPKKTKQQETKDQNQAETSLEKAVAKPDIYEFTGSPKETDSTDAGTSKEDKHSSRTSKNISTTTQDSTSSGSKEDLGKGGTGHRIPSISSSHRRQSMLGLGIAVSNASMQDRKVEEKRPPHGSSIVTSGQRGERLSARRRSMML